MKLISLNIWGGIIYEPLIKFLKEHSEDIDIFCFQEALNSSHSKILEERIFTGARSDIYKRLLPILKDFHSYYAPDFDLKDFGGEADIEVPFGNAIFVNKKLKMKEIGNIFVHNERYNNIRKDEGFPNLSKSVQFINFERKRGNYWVFNYHGVWIPGPKIDNEYRTKASKNIRKIMDSKIGAKILCGDFNLLPNTESLKILLAGMRDLVKENNITSTRNKYFKGNFSTYSDYVIVSNDIKVKDFQVLKDEVSDHAPLLLEFD